MSKPYTDVKTAEELLEQHKESALNSTDAECKQHIHSAWSAEAQANVSMGLYDQAICELCKSEISDALTENKTYISDIEALTTKQEIDLYMSNINRAVLTGGR